MGLRNVIVRPWNLNRGKSNVNWVPRNVIMGPWNVIMRPWNVNRGYGM